MYRILACLQTAHDWKLVLLAAFVCIVCSLVTMTVLKRALTVDGKARLRWILTAGVASGFGIWATHFIAMLAFDPGLPVAYDFKLTLISLLCAMGITAGGAEIALSRSFKGASLVGGAVIGSGVCTMHFLGMMSLDMAGTIRWATDLVIWSIGVGIVMGAIAMWVLTQGKAWSARAAAGLFILTIVAHHFTAMGAVTVLPGAHRDLLGFSLSPQTMSVVIAVTALGVLGLCIAAVRWGRSLDDLRAAGEKRFETMLSGVRDYAIFMLDADGRIASWNAGAERIKGYAADEVLGQPFAQVAAHDAEGQARYAQGLRDALEHGRYEVEALSSRKDGSTFWAHTVITPLFDDAGRLIGYAHVKRDISDQKTAQDRSLEVSRNLEAALGHMSQGLCLFDANERLILANTRFNALYDLNEHLVRPGISFRDLLATLIALRDGRAPSDTTIETFHARHRDLIALPGGGTLISDDLAGKTLAITHRPMPAGGWVTTFDDISERRQSEARIAHMARHDTLTGLPNRPHFSDQLDAEVTTAARGGETLCVVAIDLDGFKDLNDQRGHETGDKAMKILGERLAALAIGDRRFVARLGGDEFGAIRRFQANEGDEALEASMQTLYRCITQPMTIDGVEISLAASLGVAVYPRDGALRETLLSNADLALNRAKAQGGNRIRVFEAGMDEATRERRALVKDLSSALANDEFRVFYQVQQSVATRQITGYEALIRWQHPERGFVSPADFIPVAEESGDIVPIGAWVLRAACLEAASWNNSLRIAVNLSPVQLNDVGLIETVRSVLAETGLSPSRLELEITESTIIDDKLRALHILRQIKALGVTIAMDDFGTGYSSLDTLNAFPFDKLKIDRSFLMEADTSTQARAFVRAILALGKSLGIPVLAEGVETEAQMALLREEGCDEAQGYLLGRPRPFIEDAPPARLSAAG